MAELTQFAIQALRQAVETVCEEKNSHTDRVFMFYASALDNGNTRLGRQELFMLHKTITFAIFFKCLSLFTMHCNKAKGI